MVHATAARAAALPSTIDLVCTELKREVRVGGENGDEEEDSGLRRLEDECWDGRELGFNGKQCIHPSQVPIAQQIFSPDEREVEWAVRVVVADAKATSLGRGAFTLDCRMIDAPVVGKARATLEKADRCGFFVRDLLRKWQDQEPE